MTDAHGHGRATGRRGTWTGRIAFAVLAAVAAGAAGGGIRAGEEGGAEAGAEVPVVAAPYPPTPPVLRAAIRDVIDHPGNRALALLAEDMDAVWQALAAGWTRTHNCRAFALYLGPWVDNSEARAQVRQLAAAGAALHELLAAIDDGILALKFAADAGRADARADDNVADDDDDDGDGPGFNPDSPADDGVAVLGGVPLSAPESAADSAATLSPPAAAEPRSPPAASPPARIVGDAATRREFWQRELAAAAVRVATYADRAAAIERQLRQQLSLLAAQRGLRGEILPEMPWSDPDREAGRLAGPRAGLRWNGPVPGQRPGGAGTVWWLETLGYTPAYGLHAWRSMGASYVVPNAPLGAWGRNVAIGGQYRWDDLVAWVREAALNGLGTVLELPTLPARRAPRPPPPLPPFGTGPGTGTMREAEAGGTGRPPPPPGVGPVDAFGVIDEPLFPPLSTGAARPGRAGGVDLFHGHTARAYGQYLREMAQTLRDAGLYDAITAIHPERFSYVLQLSDPAAERSMRAREYFDRKRELIREAFPGKFLLPIAVDRDGHSGTDAADGTDESGVEKNFAAPRPLPAHAGDAALAALFNDSWGRYNDDRHVPGRDWRPWNDHGYPDHHATIESLIAYDRANRQIARLGPTVFNTLPGRPGGPGAADDFAVTARRIARPSWPAPDKLPFGFAHPKGWTGPDAPAAPRLYGHPLGPRHEVVLDKEPAPVAPRLFRRHRPGLSTTWLGVLPPVDFQGAGLLDTRQRVHRWLAPRNYRLRVENPRIAVIWDVGRQVPVGFVADGDGVEFDITLPVGQAVLLALGEQPVAEYFAPHPSPGRADNEALGVAKKMAAAATEIPEQVVFAPAEISAWLREFAARRPAAAFAAVPAGPNAESAAPPSTSTAAAKAAATVSVAIGYGMEANRPAAERLARRLREAFGLDAALAEEFGRPVPDGDGGWRLEGADRADILVGDAWSNNDVAWHAARGPRHWSYQPRQPFTSNYMWPGPGRGVAALSSPWSLADGDGRTPGGGPWRPGMRLRPAGGRKLFIAANGPDALAAVESLSAAWGAE